MGHGITRRTLLHRAMASGASLAVAGAPSLAWLEIFARKRKLNVLFMMSDQHQARAMGCEGHPVVKTPHLDRLAAEGTRFTKAFCHTPQCCPSRMTIWTGQFAHTHGLHYNGVPDPEHVTTVGHIFRDAGYATASIGKHHMQLPLTRFGFDTQIDVKDYEEWRKAQGIGNYREEGDWYPYKIYDHVGTSHVPNEQQPSGYFAQETIKFLQRHKDRPFCAWFSLIPPHTPLTPSQPWATMYNPESLELPPNHDQSLSAIHPRYAVLEKKIKNFGAMTPLQHKQALATYYGCVSQVDHNMGLVLAELERLGLAKKTIVIYTADHGELAAEHAYWTKSCLCYDALMRVPLIIRLPGTIPAGQTRDELVGLADLLPTLCDLTGQKTPEQVQGESLVPLLMDNQVAWRNTIFAEIGHPTISPRAESGMCCAARTADAKFIQNENGGARFEEFYDLAADPWEMKNEIDNPAHQATIGKLRERLIAWKTADAAPVTPLAAAVHFNDE